MRVAFVYPNPRAALLERIASGESPDTNLLGQNHLAEHGIDSFVHDSVLRRTQRTGGLAHRLTWHARELTLPWELRDADVVVTPLALLLPLAARVRRRPRVVVLSYHLVAAFDRAGAARRALMRRSLMAAERVVTIAEAATRRLVEHARLEPARVTTALLGVDECYWQPAPPARDGYVLTVGRDLARDYATFAAAVEGLPTRAIVVAKEENLRGVCVPPNVEVRLNVPPAEVRELYAGARCVVVPVRPESDARGTESSGTISLLEAMACARATVVSERSYLADYVRPETSLVAAAGDAAALREAIARVLADDGLAESLGAAARRHVEERHTTRHFGERLATILRELPCAA